MDLNLRAEMHAALGDVARLHVVDLLADGDMTVKELAVGLDMPGNLLAHHLQVLEDAGIIERRPSEGDRRRRYVILRRGALDALLSPEGGAKGSVLFVCSHNSARSQFAAAYWEARTGRPAQSAGSDPASAVHPIAIQVAAENGLDLQASSPRGYSSIKATPDLLVSVCDRAREGTLPHAGRQIHWSIPDPVTVGKVSAFRSAFSEIGRRIDDLTGLR